MIQATEAIKLILGVGEPLIGRFLIYDALKMRFRELKLRKDPDCPVCGTHPTVTALIDYEQFCGVPAHGGSGPAAEAKTTTQGGSVSQSGVPDEITVEELKAKIDRGDDFVLVDVREPHEVQICRIEGAILIPLGEVPKRFNELDPTKDLVVHCRSGARSGRAVAFLREQGYPKAQNLTGGILAWIDRIDPTQPKY
jgi:rhodanese-related sulfurtransferase